MDDIEAGGEAIEGRIDEKTPLSTSQGRTQMYERI